MTKGTTSGSRVRLAPSWVMWTSGAFVGTVFHVLIDQHLGLFGEVSLEMSVAKGLWGLTQSVLFGWWLLVTVMAATGHGPALKSSLALTGIVAFFFNGVVAIVVAPPISAAAPWQDISHFTAAVAGFMALRTGIGELRERGSPKGGRLLVISITIVLANMAFAVPLNLQAIGG